jgi:F-type H+-transporting ATPase subunit epsilon
MKQLELIITTPERIHKESVDSVSLQAIDGEITILPNHIPLITVLKAGELVIRKGTEVHPYAVGAGFAEVDGRRLTVLADSAEHVSEIDEQKAEEARARAETLKEEKRHDIEEYAALMAKLDRDLNRIRIVRKHRHGGQGGITHEGIRKG